MQTDQTKGGPSHIDHYTATEDFDEKSQSQTRGLHDQRQPVDGLDKVRARAVTTYQAEVLADLALTMLQKHSQKTAAMAAVLSGTLNDFGPEQFRHTMATLVKCASGNSLDVIGGFLGVARGVTVTTTRGQFRESDPAFRRWVLQDLLRPASPSATDELVGISLRTQLHFCPQATLTRQEAAIEKTIEAVGDEIVRVEVDEVLCLNDLWMTLRFTCQDVVIDVGEPNRPFEQILLWRGGKTEPLVGNYIVQPGERLIVEPSIPAPIDIRPAATSLHGA